MIDKIEIKFVVYHTINLNISLKPDKNFSIGLFLFVWRNVKILFPINTEDINECKQL